MKLANAPPIQMHVVNGKTTARPLPFTVGPLGLPPEVFAQLRATSGLAAAAMAAQSAAPPPAPEWWTYPGSSAVRSLGGYGLPVWNPLVLPGSVLGATPGSAVAKPVLMMPPAPPKPSQPADFVSLGQGYWGRPLPEAPLQHISRVAAAGQVALEGIKGSSFAAACLPEAGPALDVFSAGVAACEIYQEIVDPNVEGRFHKFLYFAARLVCLLKGITVVVPVSPAIEHPLKLLGTALQVGNELYPVEWRRTRVVSFPRFRVNAAAASG